ncbi:MAG: hypothetical protein KAI79_15000 [Bacteroidales bacterium]|nr:hypothetical protein [Bacteroidales bacterium]
MRFQTRNSINYSYSANKMKILVSPVLSEEDFIKVMTRAGFKHVTNKYGDTYFNVRSAEVKKHTWLATNMTWVAFCSDERRFELIVVSGGVIQIKFKGDANTKNVRCNTFMMSLRHNTERLNKMVELLNEYKPKVKALWHDNIVKGNSKKDKLVNDYTYVYRRGVMFYFSVDDGSTYVNDLEWQVFMALWKKRKARPQLRALM